MFISDKQSPLVDLVGLEAGTRTKFLLLKATENLNLFIAVAFCAGFPFTAILLIFPYHFL